MNGFFSKRSAASVLGVAAMAVAVAGCDSDAASIRVAQASVVESLPQGWYRGDQPMLRHQVDAVRGRIWVLTPAGAALYEASTGEELAQVSLPEWLWVGENYACAPDLAIGPGGEVVISSNVVSTVWRVDPVTLAASRHELVLDESNGKDVGFTGLAYSPQLKAFVAVSGVHGSMWRIDPLLQRAQNIPLSEPLPKACGLAVRTRAPEQRASRFVGLCVRTGQGEWSVNLAPDQRSGYVRPGQCVI